LSEATPPVTNNQTIRTPNGVPESALKSKSRREILRLGLRGGVFSGTPFGVQNIHTRIRWYRCAQPPATVCEPFGFNCPDCESLRRAFPQNTRKSPAIGDKTLISIGLIETK